jgi:hypothetical protein
VKLKTYLTVKLGGQTVKPSDLVEKLVKLGFKPLKGGYDFVYDWNQNVSLDEVVLLGNSVQRVLKGGNVLFKMESL